jgi:plasmid stability protein
MIFHMKTTLNIPDELMKELKRKAADMGKTLSEVVTQTLRNGLQAPARKKKLTPLPTFDCGKIYVNVADREQLYRVMEGR